MQFGIICAIMSVVIAVICLVHGHLLAMIIAIGGLYVFLKICQADA